MTTFKDLKKSLFKDESNIGKIEPKTWDNNLEENVEEKSIPNFEYEEARYMLSLIANNEFKGSDVQIVYNIALKLQTIIKELQ